MSGLAQLQEGMEVYGADNELIGHIERVRGDGFDVAGFHYGPDTVVRVELDRAYIQGVGIRETDAMQAPTDVATARGATAAAGTGAPAAGARGSADVAATGATAELATEGELRVPVVEEELRVGTREVELGEVEIHRRVVEEERTVPVTLRYEEARIEEVDVPARPLREGETAFEEGTIRVALWGEEAVIAKEAVVTGEVVVNKDVTQEERTVSGTARRTEVDVEERYIREQTDSSSRHAATSNVTAAADADFDPYDQAGFTAGSDARYTGRTFEEVEPDLRRDYETHGGTDAWESLRDRLRAGFDRARGR